MPEAERDLAELTGQAAGPVRIAAFQSVMSPLIAPPCGSSRSPTRRSAPLSLNATGLTP